MIRIICVGNRYVPGDDAGPRVYDYLLQQALPENAELIDGGLAGLNLLCFVEGSQRVIFVDAVHGFGEPGQVLKIIPLSSDKSEIRGSSTRFDHASGLQYLLDILPAVCEGEPPEILVIGIEGEADVKSIVLAGQACLEAVTQNLPSHAEIRMYSK